MDSRSAKRTVIIYLGYAFLLSSILAAICLFIEYTPSTKNSMQKFGIGTMVLNSVLWSLAFSVIGATSLFNIYEPVRKNFLVSLLCFITTPALALIIVLSFVQVPEDAFGFTETAIIFLIAQLFFFFRFRSCMKRTSQTAIE